MGIKYTPEMRQFFIDFVPGHHRIEIMEEFNKRFYPTRIGLTAVAGYIKNHNLNTGFTGRFEKGSHNGVRIKKGQVSYNHKPVGTVSIRHNWKKGGKTETWIKVSEPNKWMLYNRYIWEKHNGPIPEGYVVAFRNGDTLDCRIDNLRLVTKAAMQACSKFPDKDVRDVMISIGELNESVKRRRDT